MLFNALKYCLLLDHITASHVLQKFAKHNSEPVLIKWSDFIIFVTPEGFTTMGGPREGRSLFKASPLGPMA